MTLQQLKYIVAVEKYGSFGKAAEACGLTQPTLSLLVKKLEEELDIRIFDRDAHPVAPTGIGQKVIDKAKVVLDKHPELMAYFIYTDQKGQLSVWYSPSMKDKIGE